MLKALDEWESTTEVDQVLCTNEVAREEEEMTETALAKHAMTEDMETESHETVSVQPIVDSWCSCSQPQHGFCK